MTPPQKCCIHYIHSYGFRDYSAGVKSLLGAKIIVIQTPSQKTKRPQARTKQQISHTSYPDSSHRSWYLDVISRKLTFESSLRQLCVFVGTMWLSASKICLLYVTVWMCNVIVCMCVRVWDVVTCGHKVKRGLPPIASNATWNIPCGNSSGVVKKTGSWLEHKLRVCIIGTDVWIKSNYILKKCVNNSKVY